MKGLTFICCLFVIAHSFGQITGASQNKMINAHSTFLDSLFELNHIRLNNEIKTNLLTYDNSSYQGVEPGIIKKAENKFSNDNGDKHIIYFVTTEFTFSLYDSLNYSTAITSVFNSDFVVLDVFFDSYFHVFNYINKNGRLNIATLKNPLEAFDEGLRIIQFPTDSAFGIIEDKYLSNSNYNFNISLGCYVDHQLYKYHVFSFEEIEDLSYFEVSFLNWNEFPLIIINGDDLNSFKDNEKKTGLITRRREIILDINKLQVKASSIISDIPFLD
ncbi:hypothetical protein [Crocinitomix catalasitica]|uniref:hypothetical protein n=1 Tax=Crocinitomix catalasitica TaxID=184607 RepID=UPI0004812C35|nr:hypothetical protein [Crocinitomix catalasitica]